MIVEFMLYAVMVMALIYINKIETLHSSMANLNLTNILFK